MAKRRASSCALTSLASVALVGLVSIVARAQIRLQQEKTFSSEQAFRKSQRRPHVLTEAKELGFYDGDGRLIRRISLATDAKGFEHRAIESRVGAAIIRSTRGHEWSQDSVITYSDRGEKVGEVTPPSMEYAVSPSGQVLVANLREGIRTTPLHPHMSYDGSYTIFASSGQRLKEFRGPLSSPDSSFVFSDDGRFGAVIAYSRDGSIAKGAVVTFTESGDVLGSAELPGWMGPSKWSFDHSRRTPGALAPIARVDAESRVVVAEGFDQSVRGRTVVAVDFDGRVLWHWRNPANPEACKETLVLNSRKRTVLVVNLCATELRLDELDLRSGKPTATRTIFPAPGEPSDASTRASPDGRYWAINIAKKAGDQETRAGYLLDENLRVVGEERFDAKDGGEVGFTLDGNVVVKRGKKLHVGAPRQ